MQFRTRRKQDRHGFGKGTRKREKKGGALESDEEMKEKRKKLIKIRSKGRREERI